MLSVSQDPSTGQVIICAAGAFNSATAAALLATLERIPSTSPAIVEMSRIREFQDAALGILAQPLAQRRVAVTWVRLRHHQSVILSYLGLKSARTGEPAVTFA